MTADVHYNRALEDNLERVVNISSLTRERCTGHKYYCPDCHNEMYPTFGKKYEHHFRHLGEVCQRNNYLHATAEYMLLEEYTNCLKKGEPFLLELHSSVKCDRHCTEKKNRICTSFKDTCIVDLTKIYTSVKCEHRVQVEDHYRRPDILLTAENGEQLWIEIWVSHETVEDKRKDGHIIELKIKTEKDLEQITNHKLVKTTENELAVRLFNVEFEDKGVISKVVHNVEDCSSFKATLNKYDIYRKSAYKPDQKKTEVVEPIDLSSTKWVDLGLPSGTLWATDDYETNVNFIYEYHKNMPSERDADELYENCTREWDNENNKLNFIGPNGNSISFKIKGKHTSYWLNAKDKWDEYAKCFHLCSDKTFHVNDMSCDKIGNIRLVMHASKVEYPSLFCD